MLQALVTAREVIEIYVRVLACLRAMRRREEMPHWLLPFLLHLLSPLTSQAAHSFEGGVTLTVVRNLGLNYSAGETRHAARSEVEEALYQAVDNTNWTEAADTAVLALGLPGRSQHKHIVPLPNQQILNCHPIKTPFPLLFLFM